MRHVVGLVGVLVVVGSAGVAAQSQTARWYKGNPHAHTVNSDGDSTPDDVVRWYWEHEYHFLVLTDHNFLTSVEGLNALHGADDRFLVMKGKEVTDRFGDKPLHINGLEVSQRIAPQGGSSVIDVLNRNVAAIRRERGVPHINHPNVGWAITREELPAGARQPAVRGPQRASAGQQRRRRRRARARGGMGHNPVEASCSTGSRWTTRTRSSSQVILTSRGP